MIIRIDARKLTTSAAFHTTLAEAFGFFSKYGKNLDALVDCLSSLDDPSAGMSRIQLFPGQSAVVALDNYPDIVGKPPEKQVRVLADVIAFVNWRRLEEGKPALLALAYEHG